MPENTGEYHDKVSYSEKDYYDYKEAESGGTAELSKLQDLIAKGWRETYAELFGESFVAVLAPHHSDSIEWHWKSRIDILEGRKPEYYADFPIFSRGHMKSTLARRIAVVDAVLSYAFGVGGYCLYFSGTDDKTNKHALSVSQLLQSKSIQKYAPALSKVKRADEGSRSLGWKATFIYTEAGYVYHFGSLQSGLAGGNVDDLRPSLMIPDDIDDRKDSPAIAERNLKAFTLEILPMGKTGTLTYFAQNLISRFSIMYRIYKNHLSVLTNRRPSEPVPAVEGLEIEYRTENGIIKPFIVAGRATWDKGMPIAACEEELQRIGEAAFRSECQHEVEQSKQGLIIHTYEDSVHPISESEFAGVYGKSAWKEWYKVPFNDWSRTKTERHANVAGYLAVSSQNTRLPGFTFIVPLSFPANQMPEDVAQRMLSVLTPYAYDSVSWRDLIQQNFQRANVGQHFKTLQEQLDYQRKYLKNAIKQYSTAALSRHNVRLGAMSHSEDTVRQNFNEIFGFNFIPSNPGATDSIEDIIRAFMIDWTEKHPFREQKGYSRTFIICPDDRSQEPRFENGHEIYPPRAVPDTLRPDDLHDSDLFRYQFMNWRWIDAKLTEMGEIDNRPLKMNDDFGQALQMVYFKRLLANIPMSEFEKEEAKMPEHLQLGRVLSEYEAGEISGREKAHKLNMRQVVSAMRQNLQQKVEQKRSRR
jgi:hypothetical protein